MAKTNNKNNSRPKRIPFYRRWWVIMLFIVSLICVVVGFVLIFHSADEPDSTVDQTQSDSSDTAKPTTDDSSESEPDPTPEPESKTHQYEGEDPNQLAELTGSISYKNVQNHILTISAIIDQYIQTEDNGLCILTLHSVDSDNGYTASADIIPDITTSICETFEVDVSNLPSGKYSIDIELITNNKKGNIHDEVEL